MSIAKTEEQNKFEASRVAEMKVKSDAEAAEELAKFTAQRDDALLVQAFVNANLGIEAAGEMAQNDQNYLAGPAPKRIPLLKALLPKEAQVAGKKIELSGYVYVLTETEYNNVTGDPVHSAYLMACITEELPGKYPTMGLFGSLGSAIGLR
jgi:hypothetical protein